MTPWLKRIGIVLAGLLGLLALAAVTLVVLLERGALDGLISRQLTAALGRPVTLEGPIHVAWGLKPAFTFGPLTIANPDYVEGEPLLHVDRAEAAISLPDLVRGRVVVPRIIVDAPKARLVRLADGRTNWDFGGEPKAEEPAGKEPFRLPRIDLVELRGGKIAYEDAVSGKNLDGTLDAKATPEGERTKLVADLGVVDRARADAPPQTAHLEGLIDDPTAPQNGFDMRLQSHGDHADQLLALAGLKVPGELPGFDLDMQVARDTNAWQLKALDAQLGDARVTGKGSVRDLGTLDGLEFDLASDVAKPGPLMAAFGLGERPVPAFKLNAHGGREGDRNTVTVDGTLGKDVLKAEASTEGPLGELRGLALKAEAHGTQLGQLLPVFGLTEKPVPAYKIAATIGREGDASARVDIAATLGDTSFDAKGLVGDIRNFQALDLDLAVAGPDPADILDIFGLPKISLPPYKVAGKVAREGNVIRVRGLDGKVGNSDVAGDLSVDTGKQPPAVVADLTSNRLDFDDLAGLVGLPPSTGPGEVASPEQKQKAQAQEASSRLLPDVSIDADAWKNLNLDVRFRGKTVNAPRLPFQSLAFHVVTKDGWLTLDPFQGSIAGGQLIANVSLDGTRKPIAGDFDFKVSNLQLNEFLKRFDLQNEALGVLNGRAQLKGQGGSLRDLAATANGRVALTMEGGVMDRIIPELGGLDITQTIGNWLKEKFDTGKDRNRQEIRCFIADLDVNQGMASAKTVLLDTPEDKMTVQGKVDLRQERLDLMFHAYPRDASIGSSRMPISIEGPIKSPTISPAPGYVENRTLGWILAPLAALVPFVELGSKDDHPCNGVVDRVREATQPG